MPVFALYNFNDNTTVVDDAPANGTQNGIYLNGATASGGNLVLDGVDDLAKIYPSPTFQMDRGTLEISFRPTGENLSGPQTVLSRDSTGEHQGSYHIDVNPDGSISVVHETAGGTTTFSTDPGFYSPGDTINLSYSWDLGGAGGALNITNTTGGTQYHAAVPDTLTMDMADQSQPWMVGAGQSHSDPDILNNVDQHMQGTVDFFSLSDTVDNLPPGDEPPEANPDTATTDEDAPVVIDVLANDSDPEGGPVHVTGASAGHGSVTVNGDGTLTYTPDPDWNGTDTITYTIEDPAGNPASSTVTVTINPVNDDPVANDDSATTAQGVPVVIAPLANDTDVDGDTLSILGTPTSADGSVTVNGDGTITFTPDAGFTGTTTIDYAIDDGQGGTDTATITVTVEPGTGPDRDGIVRGTDGNDLIDHAYVDPWDGDMVDHDDAIIPGDAPNDDRIVAGAGDDTVWAGAGDDTVWAGPGDDVVHGGDGNDDLRGGPGDDTLSGGPGFDTLRGQEGDDSLEGGSGGDLLEGGKGNDTILGGSGRDTVYGGAGDDVIDTSGGPQSPDIDYPGFYPADPNPLDDRDLVYGGKGNDTITTGDDADTILAGQGDDYVDAGVDADMIHGGKGNDTLIGGEGADTIRGGDGNDLIYGGLGPIGEDLLDIPDETDLRPDNNRDLLYGGRGDDTIYGRDDADTLYGGRGDDFLDGGVDNDELYGGHGEDTLLGQHGNDSLYGNQGNDLLDGGIGNDHLDGGYGNDTLYGGEGDDRLLGRVGDDLLDGGAGNDDLHGGHGNDTLLGGDGDDTLHGNQGDDLLSGGAGHNLVYGGWGNDTIIAGPDAESLYGGGDRDTFIVGTQGDGIGDFIDGNEGGDDWDTLDLSGAGPLRIVYDAGNPENGVVTFLDGDGNPTGTLQFVNIENVIPCFTPGTLIATPKGEIPVEELKAGDRIITRDNGIQEVRWTGAKALTGAELRLNSHLQPVLVKAHSLGQGLPERDMLVSPNHRLLVANDRTQLYFDEHEVLVAAKHLVGTRGVHAVEAIGVTYIHFMCDRHEVVLSNGAWTETFQPGDYTLKGMGNAQRNEILELFPELKTAEGIEAYQAARRTLKRHEARLLGR